MTATRLALIIAAAVLAAVFLDLIVLRRVRQALLKRGLGDKKNSQGVFIFGAYSPLLTWIRYRRLEGPPVEAPAPPEAASSPEQQIAQTGPASSSSPVVAVAPPASSPEILEASLPQPQASSLSLPASATLSWRLALPEIAILLVGVLLFCAGILDLRQPTRLPGNESGVFQALDWVLYNSIRIDHKFPLWNPFLRTGIPYIADPMLHVYNPVVSLPVLIFGVQAGFKLAVALSFFFGALGMWWLGATLGMGRVARLWVALMFVFAGQPVARFFQGQYLFIFGFAWIPWAMASLLRVVRTRRKRHAALVVFSLALIFFSGNAYYAFYMLFAIIILAVVMLVHRQPRRPYVRIDWSLLGTLAGIGALALGVISVQLLPLVEFWPRLDKSLEVAGAQTVSQVFLDYTSKDPFRPDAYSVLPAREEYYAYIGLTPFLALALLPFAWQPRQRKPLLVFLLLGLFVLVWVDLDLTPWYDTFIRTKILLQFRHLLRILIFGSFAVLILAGLGLDALWRRLESAVDPQADTRRGKLRSSIAYAGLIALAVFMLMGIADLYRTNRTHVMTLPTNQAAAAATQWLRQHDPGNYYVRLNPNNIVQDVVVASRLRFIEVWYHFGEIRQFTGMVNQRYFEARANYIVQSSNEPAPDEPGVTLIQHVEGFNIYQLANSLPYAFTVSNARLNEPNPTAALQAADVTALTAFAPGPNRVEVIASSGQGEKLVVLTSHYPGWRLEVDGRARPLLNAGGFLAAEVLPGTHKYTFAYRPAIFYLSLVISLMCAGIALAMFASDSRAEWGALRAEARALPARLGEYRQRLRETIKSERVLAQAVYRQGSLQPDQPLDLPDESRVQLSVEALPAAGNAVQAAWRSWRWASLDLWNAWIRTLTLGGVLFTAALAVYLITRLWALEKFPIYFFGDEAIQVLFAEDLIARNFHGADGVLFPVYVEAAGQRWTPLISMYFHALTLTLFGKTIFVARATSALVSLLGAAAVGLTLKRIFKARFWWVGVLLVSMAPGWFLHSRTAFETVMTAAFYACFLYFYLLYRNESPRYLYAAIVFGAATFYSYSNAQAVIAAAAALLFFSDLRYHFRHPGILLRGLGLVAVLAIPLVVFRLTHPAAISEHLRMVGSYWYNDVPLQQKLLLFLQKYTYGLSPQYWFFSNTHDLERHRMAGLGQLPTILLPLVLVGLLLCLRQVRSSPHRAVILAALATPVGAAMVDIGIARVLAFTMPVSILAGLGLEWLLGRIKEGRWLRATALVLFAGLAWASFALLRTALVEGPLWFRDYGLYGMQYGARQLFEEAIPEFLQQDPNANILVSSTWANGADNFIRFFTTPEHRDQVRMDGIASYLFRRLPLTINDVFVLTPSEYQQAASNPKLSVVKMERMIPYPDGTPGFYFARFKYTDNADALFAAEKDQRMKLVEGRVVIDGQAVTIRHSQIDMGLPQQIFDNDTFTLMRGLEANPFVLELDFPQARSFSGLQADFGLVSITLTVRLYPDQGGDPLVFEQAFQRESGDSTIEMTFSQRAVQASRLRLEILNTLTGETANIHIREIHLLP